MNIIYLDNNATTRVAPEVYEAMIPYFTENYFNPSSMYDPARETSRALTEARKNIAEYLGHVDTKEILFTSCATESNNTAILGAAHANPNRRHIITTSVEHPAERGVERARAETQAAAGAPRDLLRDSQPVQRAVGERQQDEEAGAGGRPRVSRSASAHSTSLGTGCVCQNIKL